MRITGKTIGLGIYFTMATGMGLAGQDYDLQVIREFNVGSEIGTLRAVPVHLTEELKGILVVYSADKEIDPWIEMFYPPTDHLKLVMYGLDGREVWRRELQDMTLNGVWFTPVFPFDLDGDGEDEIWFVRNTDLYHPLGYSHYRLERLEAATGRSMGWYPWPRTVSDEALSHTFRNFIMGGHVRGEPVLLTAQGTYGRMGIQAWNPGMEQRWVLDISRDEPGARGSHMCPIVDIDMDGIDELMWGERCINLDRGEYVFIADLLPYRGHSDVVQPVWNYREGKWYLYTCRESGEDGSIRPRVVLFDNRGDRVWHDLEKGHMDLGWTAQVKDETGSVAYTISRGGKTAGPQGFYRENVVEYGYETFTGKPVRFPFPSYLTIPVDLDGDGYHEFARAAGEQADRKIYDIRGNIIGDIGTTGYLAMASRFMDLPGEQLLCYYPDGTVKIWADKHASDSPRARYRYEHPFYRINMTLSATGYNLVVLGGI
jgi:hypothetical protein